MSEGKPYTAGPWRVERSIDDEWMIAAGEDYVVADGIRSRSDAEYIVHARRLIADYQKAFARLKIENDILYEALTEVEALGFAEPYKLAHRIAKEAVEKAKPFRYGN